MRKRILQNADASFSIEGSEQATVFLFTRDPSSGSFYSIDYSLNAQVTAPDRLRMLVDKIHYSLSAKFRNSQANYNGMNQALLWGFIYTPDDANLTGSYDSGGGVHTVESLLNQLTDEEFDYSIVDSFIPAVQLGPQEVNDSESRWFAQVRRSGSYTVPKKRRGIFQSSEHKDSTFTRVLPFGILFDQYYDSYCEGDIQLALDMECTEHLIPTRY